MARQPRGLSLSPGFPYVRRLAATFLMVAFGTSSLTPVSLLKTQIEVVVDVQPGEGDDFAVGREHLSSFGAPVTLAVAIWPLMPCLFL